MTVTRVKASLFPRHFEATADCLMTVCENQSGNRATLDDSLVNISGWRSYMFMRLTCYLDLASQIQRIPTVPVGDPSSFSCEARLSYHPGFDIEVPTAFGALSWLDIDQNESDARAPDRTVPITFWTTRAPVDIAGWTQVVIQGGPQVLSDVIIGYPKAKVNASVNFISGAAFGGQWFNGSGGCEFVDGAHAPGSAGFSSSIISCSNNNEVTI